MKNQSKIVLSLGSNLGDRLKTIQLCIDTIHSSIATVVKVSKVYETPSWGFESDPFYNCAVVIHSSKSPQKLLSSLLSLEKKMGRVRKNSQNYEARVIDIDIISVNEEIIETDSLKVPHPEMQNRNFVLYPMSDLNLNWEHPILNKSVSELLSSSSDESNCVVVEKLISPIEKLNVQQLNYIAIEGNIGAGKTTLATKIASDCNAKLVLERFADNPFLPKFYKDQSRYAFPLEMSFLADRYQQLSDDLAQFDLFKNFIVSDYYIFKSLIFAQVTLHSDEYKLYRKMFDLMYKEITKPDLYVYLYQNTERLLENIKKRGRDYEQNIETSYLQKIHDGYSNFIKTQPDLNILIIDVSELDFVNNFDDYETIINKIKNYNV